MRAKAAEERELKNKKEKERLEKLEIQKRH